MPVPEIDPVNNYSGNGVVTTFDFDFLIDSEDQLTVLHTDSSGSQTTLVLNTDYSVNETGNESGSYITFPLSGSSYSVLSSSEKISLVLDLAIQNETNFGSSANLSLVVLTQTFDYVTRLIQILKRQVDRSVKIQEGSAFTPDELVNSLVTAKNEAVTAKNEAVTAKNEAVTAKNEAVTAELKAEKWAEESEDVEVETGKYSAKHWALKAQDISDLSLYQQKVDGVSDTEISYLNGVTSAIQAQINTIASKLAPFNSYGLELSHNGTNKIKVTAGQRWDSTNATKLAVSTDTDYTLSDGANSTMYYLFMGLNSGESIVLEKDTSATGANLATITGLKTCLGRFITDGSGNIVTTQLWRKHFDGTETYTYIQTTGNFPNADVNITHNLGTTKVDVLLLAKANTGGIEYNLGNNSGVNTTISLYKIPDINTATLIKANGIYIWTSTYTLMSNSADYSLKAIIRSYL